MCDIEDAFLSLVGGLLFAVCVAILGSIIFVCVDSIGIEGHAAPAVVLGKTFHPESTVTSYTTVGDIQVPQIQTYPESWSAEVRTEANQVLSCDVSKTEFAAIDKGTRAQIGVGSGRMSGSPYCTSFAIAGVAAD